MQFTSAHEVSMTFNHDFDVFDRILEYFDKKSYSGLLSSLVDLRYKFEAFKRKYPTVEKFSFGLYPLLVPLTDYYLDSKTQSQLEVIFNNIDAGNYFVFLKCFDEYGKESKDYYFRFSLNDPCLDEDPPEIVATYPAAKQVTAGNLAVYVNEISTCRYDRFDVPFDEMRYDFDCEENPYLVKGVGNGSYLCTADLNDTEDFFLDEDSAILYVRCKDHPNYDHIGESFTFNVVKDHQYETRNNATNTDFNVTVYNSSTMTFVDLTEVISKRDYGMFDVFVPYGGYKYAELLFEEPFECSTTAKIQCSSSRCVFENKIGEDVQTITCKRKIPQCNSYENNVMEESYEWSISKRNELSIISQSFVDDKFFVKVDDSVDAKTNCGIEINPSDGFIQMGRKDNSTFFYKYFEDSVGANIARILCLNKFGDEARSEIIYEQTD
jgi:hypothetical protein